MCSLLCIFLLMKALQAQFSHYRYNRLKYSPIWN